MLVFGLDFEIKKEMASLLVLDPEPGRRRLGVLVVSLVEIIFFVNFSKFPELFIGAGVVLNLGSK